MTNTSSWHPTIGVCLCALVLTSCGSSSDPVAPKYEGPPVYIVAGTGEAGYGYVGHLPRRTELYSPQDVVFAPDGSTLVIDWNNHRVIQVDPATGNFKLIAGVADGDFGDPCPALPATCDNVVAANSKLNHPTDIAFMPDGKMVLCAWHNSELFLIDPGTGLMSRICGNGARSYNGDNQPAINAFVDLPVSVAIDSQGRIVFCDQANMIVRRINDDGTIETIVGTPPVLVGTSLQYQFGFTGNEGPATSAKINLDRGQVASPSGRICYDSVGNLFVADTKNHCIRVVDPSGVIHQFAGVGQTPGYSGDGGPATSALLSNPRDVAVDAAGNVYIADTDNHVIRKVGLDGNINTVVGKTRQPDAQPLTPSEVLAQDGKGAHAVRLTHPYGINIDSSGRLWIVDTEDHVVLVRDNR